MAEPAGSQQIETFQLLLMFRLLDDGQADRVGYVRHIQNDEPNEQRLPLRRLDADQDVGQAR